MKIEPTSEDRILGEELTASILEFADLGWVKDANFAIGPVEAPLVGLRIVETQSQTFDVAGWAINLDGVKLGAIPNLVADTGTVKFDPAVGSSQGTEAAL